MPETMRELVWFRRDLRINHNSCISAALKSVSKSEIKNKIIGVFVLDEELLDQSPYRSQFLLESLVALDSKLNELGSRLLVLSGATNKQTPAEIIINFCRTNKIQTLHFNADYSPYARKRDEAVATALGDITQVQIHRDQTVMTPGMIEKNGGGHYTVFTPYKRKWLEVLAGQGGWQNLLNGGDADQDALKNSFLSINRLKQLNLEGTSLIDLASLQEKYCLYTGLDQTGGEDSGRERLKHFLYKSSAILNYKTDRNRADIDGTSKLSAHFKFGTIAIKEAFYLAFALLDETESKPERDSIETWISELIWREFYMQVLAHHPTVVNQEFQEKYRGLDWSGSRDNLKLWQEGKTGYPFIDASMRQLNETGWMHNRGRMATAMFLTKDLLLDWRLGEKYFVEKLIDCDTASNNGGWQWSAGTGTDAAPYFRIFNPITQGQKADPDGSFIRRWLPELAKIEDKKIHTPWELTPLEEAEFGVKIGKDYPAPIVDHKTQREKALAMYKQV